MATVCAYPPSKYALTHWKRVLRCCAQCQQMDLPSPEPDKHSSVTIVVFNADNFSIATTVFPNSY